LKSDRAKRAKAYERSECIYAFAFFFNIGLKSGFRKKLPQRIERKRDSIEFEHSENLGQFFFFPMLLINFNVFKFF